MSSSARSTRTYRTAGLVVRDHVVEVPVDHADPTRFGAIRVLAREIADPARDGEDLPLLLFLQGGPGGAGPRPTSSGGWWTTALATHRVVLLDQRGTGRSSRVDGAVVRSFDDDALAADYLACFRADAIVEDAEVVRRTVYGGRRWATLGQSFGGFITLTYLSRHPEALVSCWTTGGLPPVHATAEQVYERTVPRQLSRNRAYLRDHPEDEGLLDHLADVASSGEVVLPAGDVLTLDRLRTLGMSLGMSTGADELHWLLEGALASDGSLADPFLAEVERRTGFDANPLYMVLQESIYHQGERAGGWAAQQVHDASDLARGRRPLTLTGEATFPWMVEQVRALRPFRGVAEALAARTEWPALYDLEVLAANEVPVASVQYVDDPYVDLDLALDTADGLGASQVWVTNEYLHDGLRAAGAEILPRLAALSAGSARVTRR
ncbi:prolyl aminopeptidase 2 [Sediminihabitans luteus]|uniref:Prolyl aminopeptidase 2 n=1 Tax=Sediminihabitans luteus TaxID=1138585 RepID=A0A2M9CC80_9CELL|nr:alpha/beta fold hydrolase [Sediminihabitans luteus]PJJ68657.1 prolyl aminopeptidase 2 [Sediminihabitans luteus]GII99997.1 alpha/beta hydrolase [Sediminihabitans luteus]